MGVRDDVAGPGVPFQNRQVGQFFICRSDGDGSSAIDVRLIDMSEDWLVQLGKRRRRGDLDESVHSFGHVRHRDTAIFPGGLGADDLPVLQDIEHRAGERIVGIVQLP